MKIFQMEVRHIFPENLMKMGLSFQEGKGKSLPLHVQFIEILPIIILDEPTAALDPIAEYDVYSRFNELSKTKLQFIFLRGYHRQGLQIKLPCSMEVKLWNLVHIMILF